MLWFFVAAQPLWAGLNVTVTGCPCTSGNWPGLVFNVCNTTSAVYQVTGVQFQTPSFKIPAGNFYNSAPVTEWGTGPYNYQVWLANTVQVFPPTHCDTSDLNGSFSVTSGDGTPYNVQVMYKTGSCVQPPTPATPTPIPNSSCAAMDTALTTLTSQPSYYSTTCVPWAYNGGIDGGGFINTFENQGTMTPYTQIQIGYSNTPIAINGTCTFDPTSMGGPQYMMAVAAGQEYFNMDMINLLAIGARENAAALQGGDYFVGNAGNECPALGVGGVFNVEDSTFMRDIQGFPELYPQYGTCVASYTSVAGALAGCPGVGPSGDTYLYFFTHTAGFSPGGGNCLSGDSAQMINSVVLAGCDLWFTYDLLGQANGLCFKEQMENGADQYAAIKMIDGAYNSGVHAGIEAPILPPTVSSLANPNLGSPNGAYTNTLINFITQVRTDSSCNGSTIYDGQISWAEVEKFFFGNGGTAAAQGDGGLLLHFNLTNAQRTALENDLLCAFTKLSAHWGGSYVSYRYDWLTMMRVAKNYLNTTLPIPTSTEFNQDLANFGGYTVANPTCPGVVNETTYPSMTITSPATGLALNNPVTVCPPFNLSMSATDSSSVSIAQWTLDPTWTTWTPFAGTGPAYTASLTSTTPGMPASGPVTAWVMVGNPCYNDIVQEVYLYVQCSVNTATSTMTSTPTQTATKTSTQTPTNSPTNSATQTPSNTPTNSATQTLTESSTSTPTVTNTQTSTATVASTSTFTSTLSPTLSATMTNTATVLNTATATATQTASSSFTPTAVNSYTSTATLSSTATLADSATSTQTETSTLTLADTATNTQTETSTATLVDTATPTATLTSTFTLADTATYTQTETSTVTLADTATSSQTETATSTSTSTGVATNTHTMTQTATVTPTVTFTQTCTSTNTWEPTWTFTVTPTPVNFFIGENLYRSSGPDLPIHLSVKEYPGKVGLYIFNSAGEHVRTLIETNITGPYENTFGWDGKNKYGAKCASGIYVIYALEPARTLKGRVVLIR